MTNLMIPALLFAEGGWCEALKQSYAPGRYQPKTREEFEALSPFAVDPPTLEPLEPKKPLEPKTIEDMKAGELIAYAAEHGHDLGGLVPQAGKEKILATLKEVMAAKSQGQA